VHLTIHGPENYKRMPWKNGGGMTTELMAKERLDGDGFLWRISIAEVAMSGPFSDFSAYLRTIMLLEGDGFILKCTDAAGNPKGGKRLDRPYDPYTFDGAWKTDCSLIDGPIKDFNLMVDRNQAQGTLKIERLQRNTAHTLAVHHTALVHVLKGIISGESHTLATGDTLRIDAPTASRLRLTAAEDAILAIATIDAK
jgi:environmental stress-induced protein Ves